MLARPELVQSLYGVSPDGPTGVLVVHRGALFAALACLCLWAAFDRGVRRAATVCASVSVVGFIVLYATAPVASDALASIARVDVAALVPLGYLWLDAWRTAPVIRPS